MRSLFPAIPAAAPVFEVVAGEDEMAVNVADMAGVGVEEELVLEEMTPPWIVAGAVLFSVLAAAATKASKESPDILLTD